MLSTSLDYRKTLENVIHLAVPGLADICVADVTEPMSLALREPLVAAAVPTQADLMLEMRRRYPPPATENYGSTRVLQTGQSDLEFGLILPIVQRNALVESVSLHDGQN